MTIGVVANLSKKNADVALRTLIGALDGFGASYSLDIRVAQDQRPMCMTLQNLLPNNHKSRSHGYSVLNFQRK